MSFNPEAFPDEPEETPEEKIEEEQQKKGEHKEKGGKKMSRRAFLRGVAATTVGAVISLPNAESGGAKAVEKPKLSEDIVRHLRGVEDKRKRDFLIMSEVIHNKEVFDSLKKKAGYLSQEYGEASPFFIKKVRANLKSAPGIIGAIEDDQKSGKKNIFVDWDNPGDFTKGEELSYVAEGWAVLSPREKLSKCGDLKIKGFNVIDGGEKDGWKSDKDEQVCSTLEKNYPIKWLKGSVQEIVFDNTINSRGVHQTDLLHLSPSIERALNEESKRGKIKVSLKHSSNSFSDVMQTVHHELAHGNDWDDCRLLSVGQRIDFLYEATQSFKGNENFHSDYVSSIKLENKMVELYLKVKEYWAEIVRQQMTVGSEAYKRTNPDEAKLVEKWFGVINDKK